jgi:hypothetical protein
LDLVEKHIENIENQQSDIEYKRYFIHLAYDGSNYAGWQYQGNVPTIQQTILKFLIRLLLF